MKKADYIIAGKGIAGTVLAHVLRAREKKIILIDKPELSACSRISAGLYNPVVLKRLTPGWMVDELLKTLVPFYGEMEKLLGEKLLYNRKLVKLFAEEQEKVLWNKKRSEEVGKFLSPIHDVGLDETVPAPLGYAFVNHAGQLDVQKFLSRSGELFKKEGLLREEKLDYDVLVLSGEGVKYRDLEAGKIIFCEGYRASENPFFGSLPFNPAKGELLTVKIRDYPVKDVINKGVFILPLGNELYRVGSTFAWNNINDEITMTAREEILDQLKKIIRNEAEVIGQDAGVRPAMDDRRPVIGLHPDYPQLGIFNGLGSKGVMLAPYFAMQLADHLEKGTVLNREADVKRFMKKLSGQS